MDLHLHYRFAGEIGRGRNGTTYRLESKTGDHPYCLKTISPDVVDPEERERVRKTLRKEVEILTPLSHRSLPKIYDRDLDAELPYYVCTFHPGTTLEQFRQSKHRLKLDEAIFVVASLIDAIEYIHDNGRAHCDLHQNNILLSKEVFAEGLMIIDFGSGHRDSASPDLTPDGGHLAFKNISGQSRHRERVKRAHANDDFRANDIRAFGRALALMEACFFSNASHDQLLSYRDFCRLLQDGAFDKWEQVREHFDHVVDPDAFMTKAERHFVMRDGSRPAIVLPPSDSVPVGESVLAIINTKTFQRLRTIKQLSFCEWYFPGGTHTRFEHSLGVFGITHNALRLLSRDPNFKTRFTQTNVNGALLAGLVHDLGHYPFAHVIEHYVSGRYAGNKLIGEQTHHSSHTNFLLQNDPEIRGAIHRYWGEDMVEEVLRILGGKIPPLSELLDSPIDCDKLDYLRRDAHHCGVPYGNGLDVTGILSSLRCPIHGSNLLVDVSRVHAVEGFMIAQDQMLGAVYWHETIRAVFAMFHRFLDGVLQGETSNLIELVDRLKRCCSEFEAFRDVVVPLLKTSVSGRSSRRGSEEELYPLVQLHRTPNFSEIYRSIAKYARLDSVDPRRPTASNLFDSIMRLPSTDATSMPISWDRVKRLRMCYRDAFKEKNGNPGRFEILVDVPWGKASNRVVKVLEEDGRTERLIPEVSHLASTIFTNPTVYSAPIRVYISPRLYEHFERSLNSIRVSAEEKYFGNGNIDDDGDVS